MLMQNPATPWLVAIAVVTALSMSLGIMVGWGLAREYYAKEGKHE